MALDNARASVTNTSTTTDQVFDLYTVPAGKTALILGCAMANTGSADVLVSVRWADASAGAGGTVYSITHRVRIAAGETYYPLAPDYILGENDVLRVAISAGTLQCTLTFDVQP